MADNSNCVLNGVLVKENAHKYGKYKTADFNDDEVDSSLIDPYVTPASLQGPPKHIPNNFYYKNESDSRASKTRVELLDQFTGYGFMFTEINSWALKNRYKQVQIINEISPTVYDEFNELKANWISETSFISSFSERILNYNYQRIIGLGSKAVPYLISDMKENQNDWFWALECITGEKPYSDEDSGNILVMIEKWVKWAEKKL